MPSRAFLTQKEKEKAMSAEAVAETSYYPIVEVQNKEKTRSERQGAQNPSNRAYVIYFDGIGFLCDKEKNTSCVTKVLADACTFDSSKVAQRFMGFFSKFDTNGTLIKSEVLMYTR